MRMRKIAIGDALRSLAPSAVWSVEDEDYDTLNWMSDDIVKPTRAEIDLEVARLQAEQDANAYQEQRAAEYPDFREYLDGIVKGDSEQIQKYIDDCIAVKEKYPKPGE